MVGVVWLASLTSLTSLSSLTSFPPPRGPSPQLFSSATQQSNALSSTNLSHLSHFPPPTTPPLPLSPAVSKLNAEKDGLKHEHHTALLKLKAEHSTIITKLKDQHNKQDAQREELIMAYKSEHDGELGLVWARARARARARRTSHVAPHDRTAPTPHHATALPRPPPLRPRTGQASAQGGARCTRRAD